MAYGTEITHPMIRISRTTTPDGTVFHHLAAYSKMKPDTHFSDASFNSISNHIQIECDKISGLDKALKAGMIPNKDSVMRTPSNKMQELLNEAKKLINP